ncbi:MAG: hypothetical protein KatS3mg031_2588 [Chitinophagales bacterium]|nr:MAG: hypothetical protein KatS3mg031_2588 [Chitinophagales bacterium]
MTNIRWRISTYLCDYQVFDFGAYRLPNYCQPMTIPTMGKIKHVFHLRGIIQMTFAILLFLSLTAYTPYPSATKQNGKCVEQLQNNKIYDVIYISCAEGGPSVLSHFCSDDFFPGYSIDFTISACIYGLSNNRFHVEWIGRAPPSLFV